MDAAMEEWTGEGDEGDSLPGDVEQQSEIADETDQAGLSESVMLESYITDLHKMEAQGLVDIGNLARWKASSSKQDCGIEMVRNDHPQTFWQSDGPQPHNIDIAFTKRVAIERISLYTDFRFDESYTPAKIVVHAGTGPHDFHQVAHVDLVQPQGWCHIVLNNIRHDGVIKVFLLRIVIATMHQNGKDTHIRALKLYSPRRTPSEINFDKNELPLTENIFVRESVIR